MARITEQTPLQTANVRAQLSPKRRPYWVTLRPGAFALHLGYVKTRKEQAGRWTVRTYLKHLGGDQKLYRIAQLSGVADDYEQANSTTVLSFAQAQQQAFALDAPVKNATRAMLCDPKRPVPMEPACRSVVYFIKVGDAIKIGFTKNLVRRIQDLRSASVEEIILLAALPGGQELERYLHDLFADAKINSEFYSTDIVVRFLANAKRILLETTLQKQDYAALPHWYKRWRARKEREQ
jgi:Meiotically up-regulated gene 113